MSDRKTILLCDGGDWYDASAENISLPVGVDVDAEMVNWRKWYELEYVPSLSSGSRVEYMGFGDWLKARCGGFRDEIIEEVWVPVP